MAKVRCNTCVGSGRIMGGGMMQQDCDDCDGRGKIYIDEPKEFKIDKNSNHYKKAIKRIKALNKDLSDKEAEEIFDTELKEINVKDGDNGKTSDSTSNRQKQDSGFSHCDVLPT
jgi:hypothetical protein